MDQKKQVQGISEEASRAYSVDNVLNGVACGATAIVSATHVILACTTSSTMGAVGFSTLAVAFGVAAAKTGCNAFYGQAPASDNQQDTLKADDVQTTKLAL